MVQGMERVPRVLYFRGSSAGSPAREIYCSEDCQARERCLQYAEFIASTVLKEAAKGRVFFCFRSDQEDIDVVLHVNIFSKRKEDSRCVD